MALSSDGYSWRIFRPYNGSGLDLYLIKRVANRRYAYTFPCGMERVELDELNKYPALFSFNDDADEASFLQSLADELGGLGYYPKKADKDKSDKGVGLDLLRELRLSIAMWQEFSKTVSTSSYSKGVLREECYNEARRLSDVYSLVLSNYIRFIGLDKGVEDKDAKTEKG